MHYSGQFNFACKIWGQIIFPQKIYTHPPKKDKWLVHYNQKHFEGTCYLTCYLLCTTITGVIQKQTCLINRNETNIMNTVSSWRYSVFDTHSLIGGGEPPDPNTRKRLSLKDGKRLPGKVRRTGNTDLLDHHGLRCGIALYYDDSMVQNIVSPNQGLMCIFPLKMKTCWITCNKMI